MSHLTWILESSVFPQTHTQLRHSIRQAGHQLIDWNDSWWSDGFPTDLGDTPVIFHGSLGNAAKIDAELDWTPGSFCKTTAFHCSAWYQHARTWLLHADWRILPANEFVEHAESVASDLGCANHIFVRPDSPLKPFSGRVVDASSVILDTLDHGFYYDDKMLPVVIAPVRNVGREWRFLIVRKSVACGSAYDASTRSAVVDTPNSLAGSFAQSIAESLPPPADVYMLDVCECDGKLQLLELNPFGGADLYACDSSIVVQSVTEVACGTENGTK